MTPENQQRLQACLQELAALLYEEANPRESSDLESIEKTVRQQMVEQVSPEIALFLLKRQQEPNGENANGEKLCGAAQAQSATGDAIGVKAKKSVQPLITLLQVGVLQAMH